MTRRTRLSLGPAVAALNPKLVAEASRGGRGKYGNRVTIGPNGQGGERPYGSAKEARRAEVLTVDKSNGAIADFYPQVALEIGRDENGRAVRAVLDFIVIREFLADGWFIARFEDPKGHLTLHARAKLAALEGRGLNVRLIRS